MTEKPILFSDAMVRAILAGTLTQTRRVVRSPAKNMQRAGMCVIKNRAPGDSWYGDYVWSMRGSSGVWGDYTDARFRSLCPYGRPGDRLWVREAHAQFQIGRDPPGVAYRSTCDGNEFDYVDGFDSIRRVTVTKWTPSIHMPRWASRLTLEITSVRVERVQSISEEDARAEGVEPFAHIGADQTLPGSRAGVTQGTHPHVVAFASLWESINGEREGCSWEANPWVWCVSFKVVPRG